MNFAALATPVAKAAIVLRDWHNPAARRIELCHICYNRRRATAIPCNGSGETPRKISKKDMDFISPAEAKAYLAKGHFTPGSMLPKMEAAVKFVESEPGRRDIIASLGKAVEARAGTTIRRAEAPCGGPAGKRLWLSSGIDRRRRESQAARLLRCGNAKGVIADLSKGRRRPPVPHRPSLAGPAWTGPGEGKPISGSGPAPSLGQRPEDGAGGAGWRFPGQSVPAPPWDPSR